MLKIAHVSDTHLGYTQYRLIERKKDFIVSFEKAIDKMIEEKVDIILHTGDLFETYQPDMVSLSKCISILQKVKNAGIEFIAITGNHDRVLRRGTIPPHKILEELKLVKLVDPYDVLEIDGILIAGFRFFPKRMINALKEEFFPSLEEKAEKFKYSILMFHQGVGQYLPYEESFEMEFSDFPRNFNYYAGGHIHAFLKENLGKGIFSYAGSTEFRTKKEALLGKRGFNILDIESNEFKRVEIENLRPFEVLNLTEENVKEELLKLLDRVERHEIPPVVLVSYTYKDLEIETFKKVLEDIEKKSLLLRIDKRRVRSEEELVSYVDKGKKLADFLVEFLREQNQNEKVISLAKEIIDSNEELVEDVVKSFLKEEIGKGWEEVEKLLS
ncbi:MAG: DNA repair exonuclease [Desulfurobacteriaceae bacterium]